MSSPRIDHHNNLPPPEPFPSRAAATQNSLPSEPASRTEQLGDPPKWESRLRPLQKGGLVASAVLCGALCLGLLPLTLLALGIAAAGRKINNTAPKEHTPKPYRIAACIVAPQLLGLCYSLVKLKKMASTDEKIGDLPGSSFPGPSNAKL
ncbi:MAG: hypothetical protein JSS12_09495 [Verrucomicrobia bacterium]|nr:hypothetical protein [Verrucomicrobiota bacterium]